MHSRIPLRFAVVVMALLLTAASSPACTPLPITGRDPLERLICPVVRIEPSVFFGNPSAGGNVDPESLFLLRLLNAVERSGLTIAGPHEARLSHVLAGDRQLRTGLRAILVRATFDDQQLELWCDWKLDGAPDAGRSPDVLAVEEMTTCGLD